MLYLDKAFIHNKLHNLCCARVKAVKYILQITSFTAGQNIWRLWKWFIFQRISRYGMWEHHESICFKVYSRKWIYAHNCRMGQSSKGQFTLAFYLLDLIFPLFHHFFFINLQIILFSKVLLLYKYNSLIWSLDYLIFNSHRRWELLHGAYIEWCIWKWYDKMKLFPEYLI